MDPAECCRVTLNRVQLEAEEMLLLDSLQSVHGTRVRLPSVGVNLCSGVRVGSSNYRGRYFSSIRASLSNRLIYCEGSLF